MTFLSFIFFLLLKEKNSRVVLKFIIMIESYLINSEAFFVYRVHYNCRVIKFNHHSIFKIILHSFLKTNCIVFIRPCLWSKNVWYLIFMLQHDHRFFEYVHFLKTVKTFTTVVLSFFFSLIFFSLMTIYLVILSRNFNPCISFLCWNLAGFFLTLIFLFGNSHKNSAAKLNLLPSDFPYKFTRFVFSWTACVQYTVVNINFWLVDKEVGWDRKTNQYR